LAIENAGFRCGVLTLFVSAIIVTLPLRADGQTPSDEFTERSKSPDWPDSAAATPDDGASAARFLAIGAGIGTPSGITFIAAGCYAPIALRVSGGYWGTRWNGIQGDIGLVFNSSASFAHGISVIGGVFRTNPTRIGDSGASGEQSKMVHYFGAAYDAYLAGFYLQVGLAHGRGDYPNPQLVMQFGYMFAF
jgi:hypothetical protein